MSLTQRVLIWSLIALVTIFSPKDAQAVIVFDCILTSDTGDSAVVKMTTMPDNKVRFELNGVTVIGIIVPPFTDHGRNLAVAATQRDGRIYTIAMHRKFYRPDPSGYDPSRLPATMTVQFANDDIVPLVEIYTGRCTYK